MKCDHCPAVWEDGGWTECGYECNSYGCVIFGENIGGEGESCGLKKKDVEFRLQQIEDYEHGKIERPQWMANKFIREMDMAIANFPRFPPKRPRIRTINTEYDGVITYAESVRVISECEQHYELAHAYRKGYEDAKAGRECTPEYWRSAEEEEELWDMLD